MTTNSWTDAKTIDERSDTDPTVIDEPAGCDSPDIAVVAQPTPGPTGTIPPEYPSAVTVTAVHHGVSVRSLRQLVATTRVEVDPIHYQPVTTRPDKRQPEPGPASNPFAAPQASTTDNDALADEDGEPVMHVGPPAPTGAPAPAVPVLAPPISLRPAGTAPPGVTVQLVGLHGGAGVSTLAGLLGPAAADCGPGLDDLLDLSVPVVLVARTNAHGLDLLRRATQQWASGGLRELTVLGAVLVDDAPTLTNELARRVRSAQKALPHTWRLAWSEEYRHDPDAPARAGRGRTARICHSLLRQAEKHRRTQPTNKENTR